MNKKIEYNIDIKFDSIIIPPFRDILVLGKKCTHGRLGTEKGFQLLSIDLFSVVEVDSDTIGSVFINNYLLMKIPQDEIMAILEENVFPFISAIETTRVDFDLSISVKNIKGILK